MTTCGVSFSVEETWETDKRENEEQGTLSSISKKKDEDLGFRNTIGSLFVKKFSINKKLPKKHKPLGENTVKTKRFRSYFYMLNNTSIY